MKYTVDPLSRKRFNAALSILMASGLLSGCVSAVSWENEPSPSPSHEPTAKPTQPGAGKSDSVRPVSVSSADTTTSVSAASEKLNAFYSSWKGVPYQFGGNSRSGIDCSALTQRAMFNLGVELPRTTRQQQGAGASVTKDQVRTGDLVFFKTGETLNHVGIMMSKGQFMHASTSRGVTISTLEEGYWKKRLTGYRRVVR